MKYQATFDKEYQILKTEQRQAVDSTADLESAQLIKEIIDEFDYDNSLFKVNDYSKYSVAGNLKSLYGTMKQEHWSPEYLKERIKERLAFHKNDDPLLKYKRGNKNKGINGSQMSILSLLVKDVDQPNLFVVGDDDQSIYRFQGANLENLADYQKDFNPKIIVLLNNQL